LSNHPKVVLLDGDSYLARDRLTAIKKAMYPEPPLPTEWVVFVLPEGKTAQKSFMVSGLDSIAGEIMYPTWDGTHKTVVLTGLFNDPMLLNFLYKYVVSIPDGVTLIMWDEYGIIDEERSGKESPSWKGFRKLCSERGKAFNFGDPLSSYRDEDRVSFVVDTARKSGRTISRDDALMVLQSVGSDRGLIISEIAKLVFVTKGDRITREDIVEHVMPLSVDFPTWKFDAAFNCGDRRAMLSAAESLMDDESSSPPWDYCRILGQALKTARWHVIVAHAAAKGLDMSAEINKFTSGGYTPKETKGLPGHAFTSAEKSPDCIGRTPSPYVQSDIISFVRGVISKRSSAEEAYNVVLDNYLWLYDAHSRTRIAPHDEARAIFEDAIRACTELASFKEVLNVEKNDYFSGGK
jgi:hypothetical protein